MSTLSKTIPLVLQQKGYISIECIASSPGDISSVYKVRRPGVGYLVVKRVKKEYAVLYKAEKSILTAFSHDFLPIVFDMFEDEQAFYIAMSFVHGESLQQVIDSDKVISEAAARKYFLQLCELFEYLHGKGVIHKDCKPSNIMISNHDNVYLIDFGISKSPEYNPSGRSVSYAPPEQLNNPNIDDHRADIYSLGATIYSLLTKSLPDKNDNLKSRPDISKKLKRVIIKCMAKKPQNRYQNMADVKKALVKKDWMWKTAAAMFFMLLFTVVVFFGGQTWNNEITDRLLSRGDQMKSASNYQVALLHYERYISRRPGSPYGYERRRRFLIHRGQFVESLHMYDYNESAFFEYFMQNSLEYRNTWVIAVGEVMQHYYSLQRWGELLDMLENPKVQAVSDQYQQLSMRMRIYLQQGNLEHALMYYRLLIGNNYTVVPSVYGLILEQYIEQARIYYLNNQFLVAVEVLNTAIQQYPNFANNFDLLHLRAMAMLWHYLSAPHETPTRFILYAQDAIDVAGHENIAHVTALQNFINEFQNLEQGD